MNKNSKNDIGDPSTENSQSKSSVSVDGIQRKPSRRCMFGCGDGSSTLCRFPVHDPQRCQDWIDFFRVSEDHIRTNSLVNLRVCMKHFREKITMINGKVTRHLSVDSSNSNHSSKGTKRSRNSSANGWNGVSSAASSVHSDYTSDSEPKTKHTSNDSTKSITTKLPTDDKNSGNRKLYVITQSDENKTEGGAPGQKSKMYLILENTGGDDDNGEAKKQKITLIADKSDVQTAERIEQLLPQLINRIQNPKAAKGSIQIDSEEDTHSQISTRSIQEDKNSLPIQIQRVETLANISPPEPKAVNLSPDFLFLMKMVPKLEAIPEPEKTHIKNRIETMLEEPFDDTSISCGPKITSVKSIHTSST